MIGLSAILESTDREHPAPRILAQSRKVVYLPLRAANSGVCCQKGGAHLTLDGLLGVLKKNRRKLAVDPSARAFQERLQAEYAASLAKLLPIKQRLAATDRLIDRVVYLLHGLTDEEIAMVEGKV